MHDQLGVPWYVVLRKSNSQDFQAFTIFFLHIILIPSGALQKMEETSFEMKFIHEVGHRFGGYYFIHFALLGFCLSSMLPYLVVAFDDPLDPRSYILLGLSFFTGYMSEKTHHLAEYDADYKAYKVLGMPFLDFLASRMKRERFIVSKSKSVERWNARAHPSFFERIESLTNARSISHAYLLRETFLIQSLLHAPGVCLFLLDSSLNYFLVSVSLAGVQIVLMIFAAGYFCSTLLRTVVYRKIFTILFTAIFYPLVYVFLSLAS